MMVPPPRPASRQTASRANTLLSVAAVLATTGQKTLAWHLTGSVGLLSDAQESGVTLVSALTACWALTLGERPADRKQAADFIASNLPKVIDQFTPDGKVEPNAAAESARAHSHPRSAPSQRASIQTSRSMHSPAIARLSAKRPP
jgi:hypothetical protein